MNSRVEHFTPPKGYRLGEWDEVAGWTHSPLTNRLETAGTLLSINPTESGRWSRPALRRAFPSEHRPNGQYCGEARLEGVRGRQAAPQHPHTPAFCMNIKTKELRNWHFVSH